MKTFKSSLTACMYTYVYTLILYLNKHVCLIPTSLSLPPNPYPIILLPNSYPIILTSREKAMKTFKSSLTACIYTYVCIYINIVS
jgi:hypothetical protein